jgi:hypothetical protein
VFTRACSATLLSGYGPDAANGLLAPGKCCESTSFQRPGLFNGSQ